MHKSRSLPTALASRSDRNFELTAFLKGTRETENESNAEKSLANGSYYSRLLASSCLGLFIVGLVTYSFNWQFAQSKMDSPEYTIFCDAGSTGTRLYLFHFDEDSNFLMKRGDKIKPGLSSFASAPQKAGQYLKHMFQNAIRSIPKAYLPSTNVFVRATAGMRLVEKKLQEHLYDEIAFSAFPRFELPLSLPRKHLSTISGAEEAWYAFIAVNYLAKRIDRNLVQRHDGGLYGALDLGGKSTQIVFDHSFEQGNKHGRYVRNIDDYFTASLLRFGTDIMLQRVNEAIKKTFDNAASSIGNPCLFSGYTLRDPKTVVKGTGDARRCSQAIKNVISSDFKGFSELPPVSGEFYALSAYFYSLDAMNAFLDEYDHLLNENSKRRIKPFRQNWPRPTINEIISATTEFCRFNWSLVDQNLVGTHPLTPKYKVAHRCFEATYVSVLLKDMYRFKNETRNIIFANTIDDIDVEWAIGAFLEENVKSALSVKSHYPMILFVVVASLTIIFAKKGRFYYSFGPSSKRKRSEVDFTLKQENFIEE